MLFPRRRVLNPKAGFKDEGGFVKTDISYYNISDLRRVGGGVLPSLNVSIFWSLFLRGRESVVRKFLCALLALALVSVGAAGASAEWKFERKVDLVCPWGVGGGADSTLRPMAALLKDILGVQVEVVNVEGGSGVNGVEYTYKQPADGYTFMLGTQSLIMQDLQGATSMNFKDEFIPVVKLVHSINIIAGSKKAMEAKGYHNFAELYEYAKAHPYEVSVGMLTVTGADGASHNGVWDIAMCQMIPGLRMAAPRDEDTLREELREAVGTDDAPTVVRYRKGQLPAPMPALRRSGPVDVLFDEAGASTVLIVATGATVPDALRAARALAADGVGARVVDPRWIIPVPGELVGLAQGADAVVSVEDGGLSGGFGWALRDALAPVPVVCLGVPKEFPAHGDRDDLIARFGYDAAGIERAARVALGRLSPQAAGV